MNNIPFSYGKIPGDSDFTDRHADLQLLENHFKALGNTIIISPRRWGKTTLVEAATRRILKKEKNFRVVRLDIFSIRDEREFYTTLVNEVLKATSSGWEEFVSTAKKFLSRLVPKVAFSADEQAEFSFGVSWQEVQKNPDAILDLAESIASDKKLRIIICIDEFQNIASFSNPEAFQRKLRAHWQHHKRVAYCLYGSKRHMLTDIFTNSSKPFYKFGDIIFLEKIPAEEWIRFIIKRFEDTGKRIHPEAAALISSLAEEHPYYVQQLSQQTWFRTTKACSEKIVVTAFEGLLDQLSLLFASATDSLSTRHLNLLRALIDGETQLSSQTTLRKYGLGTSANVVKLKAALIANDIIDDLNGRLTFLDPMYRHWLKQRFFRT